MRRLRKGDHVMVTGGAHRGAKGKVLRMLIAENRVVVEGVNMVKRHMKPSPTRPGGVVEREASLAVSNVMPLDPQTGKPSRVRIKVENGKKLRIARGGAVIAAIG